VEQVFDILLAERPVILLLALCELPRHRRDIVRLRPVRRRILLRQPGRPCPDCAHQVPSVG
jgi:hypothetical protein